MEISFLHRLSETDFPQTCNLDVSHPAMILELKVSGAYHENRGQGHV